MRFGLKSRLTRFNELEYLKSVSKLNIHKTLNRAEILHKYGVSDLVGVSSVEYTGQIVQGLNFTAGHVGIVAVKVGLDRCTQAVGELAISPFAECSKRRDAVVVCEYQLGQFSVSKPIKDRAQECNVRIGDRVDATGVFLFYFKFNIRNLVSELEFRYY